LFHLFEKNIVDQGWTLKEKSFSKQKLIKTTTMSQNRLSSLGTLAIENEIAGDLDFLALIKDFAIKTFFGKKGKLLIFRYYLQIDLVKAWIVGLPFYLPTGSCSVCHIVYNVDYVKVFHLILEWDT